MYLDYKVPVISILVEMNVILPPTSVVLIDIVRERTAAAGGGLVRSPFVFHGCGDGRRCRCAFAGTGAGGRVSELLVGHRLVAGSYTSSNYALTDN